MELPVNPTFELKDADGQPHTYLVVPHPPDEGQRILWTLMAGGVEPLAAAAGGLLAKGGTLAELMDQDLGDLFGDLDWASVGKGLKSTLVSGDMPGLTKQLMRHTLRDGRELADPAVFAGAYQRNYWEMTRALWGDRQA